MRVDRLKRCVGGLCAPAALSRFHLVLTILWALAMVPTVLFWADSILWVALMSCWANFAGHFSAWQASRVEVKQDEGNSV